MTVEGLTANELDTAKRTIDNHFEFVEETSEIIVYSTDYGITLEQRFSATPVITETPSGEFLLDVKVDEDGWASTYGGEGAGKASEKAYSAAREFAQNNTRSIIESLRTMQEYREEEN